MFMPEISNRMVFVNGNHPLSCKRICLVEVMADLQPYRFEPERVSNPEDSESENEEVNDRLEGTFWCSCKRCQIMPTQR